MTAVDATRCELVTGTDSLDEAALWIGLLDAEVVVHEPAELRGRMAVLGARLVRAAERR